MFFYLWVLFGLFVLNERIILHQKGAASCHTVSPSSTLSYWQR